jgi:hypothetical protein
VLHLVVQRVDLGRKHAPSPALFPGAGAFLLLARGAVEAAAASLWLLLLLLMRALLLLLPLALPRTPSPSAILRSLLLVAALSGCPMLGHRALLLLLLLLLRRRRRRWRRRRR